jgi:ABC-type sugar transport system permease subunit
VSATLKEATATDAGASQAAGGKAPKGYLSDAQFAYRMILPLFAALLALYIFPIAYSFWLSLNRINLTIPGWRFVGIQQYVDALTDPAVQHSVQVTISYTLAVTFFTLLISLGGALLLNERFRGRELLTAVIVLPWGLSTYMAAVIWRHMVSQEYGLLNGILYSLHLIHSYVAFISPSTALYVVAIAHSWQMAPLGIFFFLAALSVIPTDLYRIARLDGLGVIGRFRYVTLPYIRTAVLIVMVIVSVEAARAFDVIYFLTQGGPGDATTTLTWHIYQTTFVAFNIGYGAAISYLLVIWIFVVTTLYFLLLYRRRASSQ